MYRLEIHHRAVELLLYNYMLLITCKIIMHNGLELTDSVMVLINTFSGHQSNGNG